jgi:FkbM family methyltransferase
VSLLTTLRFIINHPLNKDKKLKAVLRFIKWQLSARLTPYPIVYPFTERSKLIIKKGMTGATGNLYTGIHEYNDMCFLLHFLRKEDLFVDVGANVGSYTVLAAAHIGSAVISVEPVPATYNHLLNNIYLNNIHDRVSVFNIALGGKNGYIDFTSTLDTVNHVATKDDKDVIQVEMITLDNLLAGKKPSLLKIDVEGFETEVINGAGNTLLAESLKAIIIELNGSGVRYGYDEKNIHAVLLENGFIPFFYGPVERKLTRADKIGTHNTIYLRDLVFVEQRLRSADMIKILDKTI